MTSETEAAPAESPGPEELRPGWRIHDIPSADWALSRVADAKRELQDVAEQEAAAIARVRQRADALRAPLLRTVDFFTAHLRMWAEDNRDSICRGGRKSRALLSGRVGFRNRPLRLVVRDSPAFNAWAQGANHGRMVWVPDMDAVRADFRMTGDIPPGCDTEGGDEVFDVRTAEIDGAQAD